MWCIGMRCGGLPPLILLKLGHGKSKVDGLPLVKGMVKVRAGAVGAGGHGEGTQDILRRHVVSYGWSMMIWVDVWCMDEGKSRPTRNRSRGRHGISL